MNHKAIVANLAVVGRFHTFELARELHRHKILGRIMSTYPACITARWDIPKQRIRSEVFLEAIRRYAPKLPGNLEKKLYYVAKRHATNSAKHMLHDADVFIGWSGSSLEALVAAREKGITTILERSSCHSTEWRDLLSHEMKLFGKKFDPMIGFWQRELLEYELADYISVPSSFVKESFIKYGTPKEKLLVNSLGVDLTSFHPGEKTDDVFRVVYAGGLTPRKGAHYLLQAFRELDLPNSEFIHMGTIADEMKPFIRKYANEKFQFLGHVPQSQMQKHYTQSSVFVIMSVEDGFAMVICQAMACGLPVICTNNTGGKDLIGGDGHAGFVIPIRNVDALKEKLLILHSNPELLARMGSNARKQVEQGFTWKDYGDRYAINIQQIMGLK